MKDDSLLRQTLQETKILRSPKHNLATFGTTTFHYVLLSSVTDPSETCRLREGDVTAQRPKILTPDLWQKRFEGFGQDQDAYRRQMERLYGEALRALEYTFRNEIRSTSLEKSRVTELIERVSQAMAREDKPRTALLQGPDETWGLSIMKFIIDMSLRSFPVNVRELEEHGLFNPARREEEKQRQAIERLFKEARQDVSRLPSLAAFLKQSGLFAEYEDRFFSLIPNQPL
ncbi:MAG: hypothetical protein WC859_08935 [Elusimicrobiota bacterium]|jgi:hypothetical protein